MRVRNVFSQWTEDCCLSQLRFPCRLLLRRTKVIKLAVSVVLFYLGLHLLGVNFWNMSWVQIGGIAVLALSDLVWEVL